jgi:hypothetical protein
MCVTYTQSRHYYLTLQWTKLMATERGRKSNLRTLTCSDFPALLCPPTAGQRRVEKSNL